MTTDIAVLELSAAASNLGHRCQGLTAVRSIVLEVLHPHAAFTRLSHMLLALAPLAHLSRCLLIKGSPFEEEDLLDVLISDGDSDSDDDSEAGVHVLDEEALMVLRGRHVGDLAQALPDLQHLCLSYCRVTSGVLPLLCSKLTSLKSVRPMDCVEGAVAAADMVAFCCMATRPVTLAVGCWSELTREASTAQHTLRRYPGVLGRPWIVYSRNVDDDDSE